MLVTTSAGTGSADELPDYAPIPPSAMGPALNEQGYHVGRVERNLYWVTDGVYNSAFLVTGDGVALFYDPASIGVNLQRAVDEMAAAEGVSNTVNGIRFTLTTTRTTARPPRSSGTPSGSGTRRLTGFCSEMTTRPVRCPM